MSDSTHKPEFREDDAWFSDEQLAKLTPADCKAFHAARFLPNATLVSVVGDFKTDELVAEITRLTAGWKSGLSGWWHTPPIPPRTSPEPPVPDTTPRPRPPTTPAPSQARPRR